MAQKLKLHSPVGAEPLMIKWPVATSEGKEGPEEIVDTIRLVCEDFPELSTPLATRILKQGEDYANYDFEQTRSLCERYNKAIDSIRQLVKGSPRLKQVKKKASRSQLKHILQQCYNQSVKDPEKLNHYEPFSPEVYGETSFELVEQMIKSVNFSDSDYFIDLGSGVGQVVLQVSAATSCNFCYGIEKAEWPAEYAVGMEKEFRKWMKWYGKDHGKFLIEKGDFLHNTIKEKLSKATIVFVNNFAFGPKVDHELKQRFANSLKEGARIVSSKAFCPLNFRITERNLSDIGTIMQVEELSPLCGAVSWTGKPFAYYVHTIDRTLLEKYFQRLRNPNKKDESEPRKDRRGRPVMSVKDRINGALSGAGSDSNSTITTMSSSRWRRLKTAHDGEVGRDTGSPLQLSSSSSSAIKVLDFDSCSNSSQLSNSGGGAAVFGPTTRRQWNEYVKRPWSQLQSCTENDDSSNGNISHDNKESSLVQAMQQKKKKMKTVKRLNNGVLGKRLLQQKQGHKKKIKEKSSSPPNKSKGPLKLRPRQSHHRLPLSDETKVASDKLRNLGAVPGTAGLSITTTTASTSHASIICPQPAPSLDSLNLLHAHTVMSTSGKECADSIHYNDRRMTETSNAYFKPMVQKQTVSMLEKHAGFLDMIESMKQRFLSFLTFMQTPQYKAMLMLQIEQEKSKNADLKAKSETLEKDISVLQKDGLGLIKDRLKEMGIKADTPRELISQAKDIVLSHQALRAQTEALGAQISALQAEHNQKISTYRRSLDKKLSNKVTKNGISHHEGRESAAVEQHQKVLITNVDRLHAELQELKDVNKNYTQQQQAAPSFLQKQNPVSSVSNTHNNGKAFVLKEKLDMKENYDTFDEVLATLKQEISNISFKTRPATVTSLPLSSSPSSLSLPVTSSLPSSSVAAATSLGFVSSFKTTHSNHLQKTPMLLESKAPISTTTTTTTQAQGETSISTHSVVSESPVGSVACRLPSVANISTSWTTTSQVNSEGHNTTSPRILPPGTKIDIKKASKVVVNGIKSPQLAKATKVATVKASSLLNYHANGLISPTSGALYTDSEKSVAHNLISMKEGRNHEVSQQTNVNRKHVHLINSLQSPATLQNTVALMKSGRNFNVLSEPSRTTSTSSPLHTQYQQIYLGNPAVELGRPRSSSNSTSFHGKAKIVSSLQSAPNNSNLTKGGGRLKHKITDNSATSGIGHSVPKFRTLEPKQDGSKLSSLLSTSRTTLQPFSMMPDIDKSASTMRHLLTAPSISVGSTINASNIVPNSDPISYLAIQSPSNGTHQPAMLKLVQQQQQQDQQKQHQQVVFAPKAASTVLPSRFGGNNCVATGSNSKGSTFISAIPSSLDPSTVKLMPSTSRDSKDVRWYLVVPNNQPANNPHTALAATSAHCQSDGGLLHLQPH